MKKTVIALSLAALLLLSSCSKNNEDENESNSTPAIIPPIATSSEAALQSIQQNYTEEIVGTWYNYPPLEEVHTFYIRIYEFTPDGTAYKTVFKYADLNYPENHTLRMATYALTTYRDRPRLDMTLNTDNVLYWEVTKNEAGDKILHIWQEEDDGSIYTEDFYTDNQDSMPDYEAYLASSK